MNHTILIAIAVAVLVALLVAIPSNESFGYELHTTGGSVDCSRTPNAPACRPPPSVNPVGTGLTTCAPSDGQWSTPSSTPDGRSKLTSPCCQPPNYSVANGYRTCDDQLDPNDATDQCIARCCQFAKSQANSYDPSWYPMARCACSLWCKNKTVPHFSKWGTAEHYITGDLAEAQTSDSGDFIKM